MSETKEDAAEEIIFSSSLKDDVWHNQSDSQAYEWWYFDALSDDGGRALTIVFFDNFILSPRYNSNNNETKIPALLFSYFEEGKPVYQIIREFPAEEFISETKQIRCHLGENSFKFDSAPYGSGYLINIRQQLTNNTFLEARLEWLLVESDFCNKETNGSENSHYWNLVAPRADVSSTSIL